MCHMFKSGRGSVNTTGCLATQNYGEGKAGLFPPFAGRTEKKDGTLKKKVHIGRRDDANVSMKNQGRGAPAANNLFMSAAHARIHIELRDPS